MTDNFLSKISGEDVARAFKTLPPCTAASPAVHDVVIDAAELGRVRIVFVRSKEWRGELHRLLWTADRAERFA